jgi:2-iminobutanoate/2-iminopropanoate deaminase
MFMKLIHSTNAPKAVGPYSQAVASNGLLFCSGQIGLDPQTQTLAEGIEAQTHQVLKNLRAVLKAAGVDFTNVVKTTIFVVDMNDFVTVNEIYAEYFGAHKPARATIGVASLPKGAVVEIEAIAQLTNTLL